MLKTLNMALVRCPVGFSEEINAILQMKKSQIDTENDKNPQNLPFFEVSTHFLSSFRQTSWIGTF